MNKNPQYNQQSKSEVEEIMYLPSKTCSLESVTASISENR